MIVDGGKEIKHRQNVRYFYLQKWSAIIGDEGRVVFVWMFGLSG